MRFRDAWRALWQGEKKASAAAPLIALEAVGRPVWTPRRYDALAAEGYQKNVVAYRAINEVARGVASVPWRLYSGPGRRELSEHPLLRLVRRPNPAMGQSEFFAAVTGFFITAAAVNCHRRAGKHGQGKPKTCRRPHGPSHWPATQL